MSSPPRPRTEVEVRTMARGDVAAVRELFERVPEGDRTFFRQDVLQPGVIESWLDDPRQRRLLAIVDGVVVGHAAVIAGVG